MVAGEDQCSGSMEDKTPGLRAIRLKNTGGRPDPSSSGYNLTKAGRCGLLSRLRGITCNVVVLNVSPSSADTRTWVGPKFKPYRGC